MKIKISQATSTEGSFSVEVRMAHDHAVEQRRVLRNRIQQKHAELARIEYEREVQAVDMMVAQAMQAAIERGEKRGDIRRALRTNSNETWKKYMSLLDPDAVAPRKPDPDAGKIVYVTDAGWKWNFTDRTVTNPDGEVFRIGTAGLEFADRFGDSDEKIAGVSAMNVPGANDNKPDAEQMADLTEKMLAGEVEEF